MNRMNNNLTTKLARHMVPLLANSIELQGKMRRSYEAQKAIESQNTLAREILQATDDAKTIEDVIHCEMVLQRLDKTLAQTERDRTGIENAERDYKQLAETVQQMRKDPEAYFRANLSIRETGGDFKKIPRSRGLQQISANKARMQNRASFAPEEQRNVWEARVKLAEKTEGMLRTFHNNLVKNRESLLKDRERESGGPEKGIER